MRVKRLCVGLLITYLLRLGSGAAAQFTADPVLLWCLPVVATAGCGNSLRGCVPEWTPAVTVETDAIASMSAALVRPELKADGSHLHPDGPLAGAAGTRFLLAALAAANLILVLALVCHMMPAQGGSSSGTRDPPGWGPEMAGRYSFSEWTRDLLIWSIAQGDVEPHRQCAMVVRQLRGAAQELGRTLDHNIILNRGMLNGVHVDGMTYLLSILSERYVDLGEEVRLKAITELMQFTRQGNETIE